MFLSALVMEDNTILLSSLQKAFEQAGWDCRGVTGVAAALRAVRQRAPNAIVADYGVIDGTAADLLAALKSTAGPAIPVVLVSAQADLARHTCSEYSQVQVVLEKPVSPTDVVELAGDVADRNTCVSEPNRLISFEERRRLLDGLSEENPL